MEEKQSAPVRRILSKHLQYVYRRPEPSLQVFFLVEKKRITSNCARLSRRLKPTNEQAGVSRLKDGMDKSFLKETLEVLKL